MEKRQVLIVLEVVLVVSIITFIGFFSTNPGMLGFTVYNSQPSSEGKDAYIRENSGINYDSADPEKLKVGKTPAGLQYRSLLEFNLSSIPPGDTVLDAAIQLYASYASSDNNITVKAYRITSPWQESEVNWTSASLSLPWTTAGGDYGTEIGEIVFTNITGWYELNITNAARGWVNGSYNNYGMILVSSNAGNGDYRDIESSDSSNSGERPIITAEYVENAKPEIINLSTDTSSSSPKNTGQSVTFIVDWNDLENNPSQLYICNSTILFQQGCTGFTFCNTSLSSSSPLTCSYTISSSDNRTTAFYAAVCDSSNCSDANQSYFYMNHPPIITLIQPNGGETINQSLGNYLIKFNVSDADADSLHAGIYYGLTQNSTTNQIADINLAGYCSDLDSTTKTTNNCSYSWNSSGVYGSYYLLIVLNDTYSQTSKSSNSGFNVVSIIDNQAPQITAYAIDSGIYSGKTINILANVSDANIKSVWISGSFSSSNITMTNYSYGMYNASFTAGAVGSYNYKIYAEDIVGNLNNSMALQQFNVSKPSVSVGEISLPSTALPYSTIKVQSSFNSTTQLKDVYAYLNVPSGFTFLSNYPQNLYLGNFSDNQSKDAIWFLSTPLTESNYPLNITYSDAYSNLWNSSNANIYVTSSVGGGYSLILSGYPEVESADNYFTEAFFKQNGMPASPDSIKISLYDALGNLIVDSVSMSNFETGTYNYSYLTSSGQTEGLWQTVVNATKSSVSYYASQFWNFVGGIFDVRDIVVNSNVVPKLNISVTTENTGGVSTDLTLVWNLTREDTGALLDAKADTFAVDAYSEKNWTIYPETTYVGQVRITMIGTYSGTEKAGAFKVFSTVSSGTSLPPVSPGNTGGFTSGGGAATAVTVDFKPSYDAVIDATKNIEKISYFTIENTGGKALTNVSLIINDLDAGYYNITPLTINSIAPGKSASFEIRFFVTDFTGERDFSFTVKSNEIQRTYSSKINVLSMADYFTAELSKLQARLLLVNASEQDIKTCQDILDSLKKNIENEEFITANQNLLKGGDCISNLEKKSAPPKKSVFSAFAETLGGIKMNQYLVWIITWGLIAVLIIILIVIIYILKKKLGLSSFINKESPISKGEISEKTFDEKLKNIQKKLGQKDSTEL